MAISQPMVSVMLAQTVNPIVWPFPFVAWPVGNQSNFCQSISFILLASTPPLLGRIFWNPGAEGGVPETIYASCIRIHRLGKTFPLIVFPVETTTAQHMSFVAETDLPHQSPFPGPVKGLQAEGNHL